MARTFSMKTALIGLSYDVQRRLDNGDNPVQLCIWIKVKADKLMKEHEAIERYNKQPGRKQYKVVKKKVQ